MSRDHLLTRSEIAAILKISPKQAGRLMDRLPTLRIGKSHRRVLRSDLEAWIQREREQSIGFKVPRMSKSIRPFANPNARLILAAKLAQKSGRK